MNKAMIHTQLKFVSIFFFTLLSLANTFTVLHLFCFPFKLVSPLNTVSSFLSANVLFIVWYQLPCCLRQCLCLIAKHLHMVLVKHDSHSCVSIAYLSSDFYLMCDIRVICLWNSDLYVELQHRFLSLSTWSVFSLISENNLKKKIKKPDTKLN